MSCPYLYSCLLGSQPAFDRFHHIEVDPVEVMYCDNGVEYLGVCKKLGDKPVLWTVYGRCKDGEILAITDRSTESSARRIADYFERRFGVRHERKHCSLQ